MADCGKGDPRTLTPVAARRMRSAEGSWPTGYGAALPRPHLIIPLFGQILYVARMPEISSQKTAVSGQTRELGCLTAHSRFLTAHVLPSAAASERKRKR